jgi:serine protease AprX
MLVAAAPAVPVDPTTPLHRYAGPWQATNWSSTSTSTNVADVATMIGATSSGADGTGVGVALIDTGVAPVPGLPAAQVVNGPDLSFESQGATVRYLDTFGHGTHMAGIIVGNDSTAGMKGIAPKAKLTSLKVGTAAGVVDVSQMIAALDWVVEHRNDDPKYPIRVINLAYGTNGTRDPLRDPIIYAAENAWRKGIVVVAAGGNLGNSTTTLTNPSNSPYLLSVGSASTSGTSSYADDTLSTFTSTSATRNVDLLAPGESIVSLRDPGGYADVNYPGARVGDRLFRGSGSSQATAVVSGAVALLLQKRPTLTPDQVKAVLKASATPITKGLGATMKLGELNLTNALKATAPTTKQAFVASSGSGSIDLARGGVYVTRDNNQPLWGEFDVFGPFSAADWAAKDATESTWTGGTWMGRQMAGAGWTGSSWASKTWASAAWTGGPWGSATWLDSNWSGRYWSGRYWSSTNWSGRYWSSDLWANAYWG